jgi:hypothetical protein
LWEQAQTVMTDLGALRIPGPEAMLQHLVSHDLLQHANVDLGSEPEETLILRRKYDIYLLLRGVSFDWDQVYETAVLWDSVIAFERCFADVDRLFEFQYNPEIVARFKSPDPRHLSLDYAEQRVIIFDRRWRGLSWRFRLRLFRRTLLPSAEAIRRTYPGSDRPLWQLYITRLIDKTVVVLRTARKTTFRRFRQV